jgi:uncharacterized protein
MTTILKLTSFAMGALALAGVLLCSARGASAQAAPAGPQPAGATTALAAQYPIRDSVNDYAGVLDPDMRAQLLDATKQIEAQHRVHVNIVVVRTLNGAAIGPFSTAVANNWESRHTAITRSVQILLDIDERKMRFEICQNLEKVITDADANGIQQEMAPMLHEGEYGRALLTAAQNVSDLLAQKEQNPPTATAPRRPAAPPNPPTPNPPPNPPSN